MTRGNLKNNLENKIKRCSRQSPAGIKTDNQIETAGHSFLKANAFGGPKEQQESKLTAKKRKTAIKQCEQTNKLLNQKAKNRKTKKKQTHNFKDKH